MQLYYPEMNQARPENTQIDAERSYTCKHWYLTTRLELKGRGVKLDEVLQADHLVEAAKHKAGMNVYHVTDLAFKKIEAEYIVSKECLLD